MVSVSVLPKPKSFGFYRNPLWTETKTETQILGNFCPFLLIWKLNWALGDINSSKIMCCWKAIFVWKQCWCHYETCKSCWNFSISYTYIYFVYTYLLFSTSFGFGSGFTKTVRFRFRFYRNPKSGFCWPLFYLPFWGSFGCVITFQDLHWDLCRLQSFLWQLMLQ